MESILFEKTHTNFMFGVEKYLHIYGVPIEEFDIRIIHNKLLFKLISKKHPNNHWRIKIDTLGRSKFWCLEGLSGSTKENYAHNIQVLLAWFESFLYSVYGGRKHGNRISLEESNQIHKELRDRGLEWNNPHINED